LRDAAELPVSIFGVVSQEGEETREDNVDAVVGESRGLNFETLREWEENGWVRYPEVGYSWLGTYLLFNTVSIASEKDI
jgi:hypothetical protein